MKLLGDEGEGNCEVCAQGVSSEQVDIKAESLEAEKESVLQKRLRGGPEEAGQPLSPEAARAGGGEAAEVEHQG